MFMKKLKKMTINSRELHLRMADLSKFCSFDIKNLWFQQRELAPYEGTNSQTQDFFDLMLFFGPIEQKFIRTLN